MTSEGLSSAEAAKELQHHRHATGHGHEHDGRIAPILEAILLSLVTIMTAWAGYSAAKWNTESRLQLAHASTLRVEANRALGTAAELRDFDSSTFNAWFIAYTLGDQAKMRVAENRFRPEFRVAFEAWQATDPEHNPNAPAGPTYMPEYQQPAKAQADQLDHEADAAGAEGEQSGGVADDYVRITVILAAVLFLVGIGSTFKARQIRYGLVAVGSVLLVAAVFLIVQEPLPP